MNSIITARNPLVLRLKIRNMPNAASEIGLDWIARLIVDTLDNRRARC